MLIYRWVMKTFGRGQIRHGTGNRNGEVESGDWGRRGKLRSGYGRKTSLSSEIVRFGSIKEFLVSYRYLPRHSYIIILLTFKSVGATGYERTYTSQSKRIAFEQGQNV